MTTVHFEVLGLSNLFSSFSLSNLFFERTVSHCNENHIYVFLFWELRALNPNFHIHVSVSDLYISRIGPHISCGRIGKSIVGIYSINRSQMHECGIWDCVWLRNSFSGNICLNSVLVLCSQCTRFVIRFFHVSVSNLSLTIDFSSFFPFVAIQ